MKAHDNTGSQGRSKGRFSIVETPGRAFLLGFFAILTLWWLGHPKEDLLEGVPRSNLYLDRHGQWLQLEPARDEQLRLILDLEEFPREFTQALCLYEDRWFYFHRGVNPWSLLRAFWTSYITKERRIGGSTLTMQTARLRYGIDSSTVAGKLNQIARALYLELYYSKKDILEVYLNLAPCGGNISGFPAASMVYFRKSPRELNLNEILALVVVPQDPNQRLPGLRDESSEQLDARRRLALEWIDRKPSYADQQELLQAPLRIDNNRPFQAPHFIRSLSAAEGTGRINTTLDLQLQKDVGNLLGLYLNSRQERDIQNGSILVVHCPTMEVRAYVGSAGFFNWDIQGQVDGIQAPRSPGSTLKPFIYGLALDQGLIHPQTLMRDAPVSFGAYTPDNYLSDFAGVISATHGLTTSRNIPAVALASQLENPDLYGLLEKLEISRLKGREHYGLSIVLGGMELTMEELVRLYGALWNNGRLRDLRYLQDSPRDSGSLLFSHSASYMVMDMLYQNPPPEGTAPLGYPVAYKTGTSIGFRDCWTLAFMGDYLVAVWVGNFDGRENHHFLGRAMAAPLAFQALALLEEEVQHVNWQDRAPDELRKIQVCAVSGGITGDHCPDTLETWFIPGVSPIDRCEIHQPLYLTLEGLQTLQYAPDHHRTEVWEIWPSDVMELFAQAGLPRRSPPPYKEELEGDVPTWGSAPLILNPREDLEYHLFPHDGLDSIAFRASAEGDVDRLFWFLENRFIGSSAPGETLEITLALEGDHRLWVVDQRGRVSREQLLQVRMGY